MSDTVTRPGLTIGAESFSRLCPRTKYPLAGLPSHSTIRVQEDAPARGLLACSWRRSHFPKGESCNECPQEAVQVRQSLFPRNPLLQTLLRSPKLPAP